MNILVVQKNKKEMEYIKKGLIENGYLVEATDNYEDTLQYLTLKKYELVILDTFLNDGNVIELLKKIKKIDENMGILFVTTEKNLSLKLEMFENGADDYLERPFSFLEMLARIKAILKRLSPQKNQYQNLLKIRGLTLNMVTREVVRDGKNIELTPKEFNLLEYFMRNKNIILSRTVIKEQLWGIDFVSDTNVIDVYVTYLRNKIDKDFKEKLIHTVRGVGYILKE